MDSAWTTTFLIYTRRVRQAEQVPRAGCCGRSGDREAGLRPVPAPRATKNEEESTMTDTLTPPQIAKLLHVRHDKVLAWIRSGELSGFNIVEKMSGRPRYRVRQSDLDEFINRRKVIQPAKIGRPPGHRRFVHLPEEIPSL